MSNEPGIEEEGLRSRNAQHSDSTEMVRHRIREAASELIGGADLTPADDLHPDNGLYAWSQTFSEAVKETDPHKLHEKVAAAEAAIFHRLQDLAEANGAEREIMALRKATDALLSLKTDVLRFPDWRHS